MTAARQTHPNQGLYYHSASDGSPLAPRGQDVVPVGTVASRIMELQKLAMPSKSDASRSLVTRRREKSRTGFGRRVEPRFGQPASRSSKPDEEIYENPKHSFLGLNANRGSHMEEHALVSGKAKWDRISGLHGQLQPSGLGARVQYEATSPWSVLLRKKSRGVSQQYHGNQDMGTPANGNIKNQLSSTAPNTSVLERTLCLGPEEIGNIQENPTIRTPRKTRRYTATDQGRTSCEWLSVETSSTMRRQSVRDLYYDYGVRRPAGLASSENSNFNLEAISQPSARSTCCHSCSRPASIDSIKCKCGHALCKESECSFAHAVVTSHSSAECVGNGPKHEGQSLYEGKASKQPSIYENSKQGRLEQPEENSKSKQKSTQEKFQQKQISTKQRSRSRENAGNIPIGFPVLRLGEVVPSSRSEGTQLSHTEVPDSSNFFQQTSIASETFTSVPGTQLPFTRTLLSTYPSSTIPITKNASQVKSQDLHHGRHHKPKTCRHGASYLSSSTAIERGRGSDNCDTSACHTARQRYQPYHHSSTCARKRRRYPEETDSGYIAGASHLEELEEPRQKGNPGSSAEILAHSGNSPGKQHLSPCRKESKSPQGQVHTSMDSHLSSQQPAEEYKSSPQNFSKHQGSAQYNQESLHHGNQERHLFNKPNASRLGKLPPNNQRRMKDAHDDKVNALNISISREFEQCMDGNQNQLREGRQAQNPSHVHKDHNNPSPQISHGGTTASNASVVSLPTTFQSPPKSFFEKALFHAVEQSTNVVSPKKPHIETKSPNQLNDRTALLSWDTIKQGISSARNNQSAPDICKTSSDKSTLEEDLIKKPLDLSQNLHQSKSWHYDEVCDEVNPQNPHGTLISVESTAIEEYPSAHHESPCADLDANITPSSSIQPSRHLSPRKFQPASRRLSAFFQLQEQNIVSLLNKRLQQHQNELKRIERISDGKLSVTVQRVPSDQEQGCEVDVDEKKVKQESAEGKPGKNFEEILSDSPFQTRPAEKVNAAGTDSQGCEQDIPLEPVHKDTTTEQQQEEHDCAWRRMAMKDRNGISKKECSHSAESSARFEGKDASDVGINGITIVIHLEGIQDVVIKADLSPGI